MRSIAILATAGVLLAARLVPAQRIASAGRPAQLDIRAAGHGAIRLTLRPVGVDERALRTPALADHAYPAPAISVRALAAPLRRRVGTLTVEVRPEPLTVRVTNGRGDLVQELSFERDGTMSFRLDDRPVLGLGEGGPRPQADTPWRDQPIQFDRRGQLDTMEPRWQSGPYGSRNPVAMLVGTAGW